jgi:DNA-binding transcriptional LysR family regulator
MDIFKLKTFYHVAKLGSLTQASKELNYSISNLSRQLTALEQDLDLTLFHRKGNKLVLTEQGTLLFKKSTQILDDIESARQALHKHRYNLTGLLKISTTTSVASLWLTPHIKGFLTKYPHMRLHIHGDDTQSDFAARNCDIWIGYYFNQDPDLIQKYLMTSRTGLYASKAYLEKFGTPTTLQQLDQHQLIARNAHGKLPSHAVNWHLCAGNGKDGLPREAYISAPSHQSVIDLVADNMGIGCLSDTVKSPKQDHLIPILQNFNAPSVDVFYTYHKDLKDDNRVICFYDYLLEQVTREHAIKTHPQ